MAASAAALVFTLQLCHPTQRGLLGWEAAMYLVIRKFSRMRTVGQAARRAESGIGKLIKEAIGFRGYYIFDAGGGVAGSVTLVERVKLPRRPTRRPWLGSVGALAI